MTASCTLCNRVFRDSYDLKRHKGRKTPCVIGNNEQQFNQNSGLTIINNGIINVFVTAGNENLQDYDLEILIECLRNLNKTEPEAYMRAMKLITKLQEIITENPQNKNVRLKSTKSMTAELLTELGTWKQQPVRDIMDQVIRVRSGQLIHMKESIHQHNNRVFQVPLNKITWKHVEQFNMSGIEHEGPNHEYTRRARTTLKVALLE